MAEMSNYLENALINATLRATTFTSPTTVYVGLYTSDPTDANSGTECSGGSYARKSATFGDLPMVQALQVQTLHLTKPQALGEQLAISES